MDRPSVSDSKPKTAAKERKRAAYSRYVHTHGKVPRQTIYNWKKRALGRENQASSSVGEEMEHQRVEKSPKEAGLGLRKDHKNGPEDEHNFSTEEIPEVQCEYDEFVFPQQQTNDMLEGKLLFPNSDLTVGQCVFLILTFFIKHSLNKQTLKGLFGLVALLLPKPNNFPSTLFLLNKIVFGMTQNYVVKKHYYCQHCTSYISSTENNATDIYCSNCEKIQNGPGIFVEFPLENVLKNLMEDRGLFRFYDENNKSRPGNTNKSGVKYNEIKNNVLTNKYDIVLAWNTDGVPIFKSSDLQLWPLQITILDIPPIMRYLFVSVCGLWIGSCKPNMNTFLKPFCESLRSLFENGFKWIHPVLKIELNSRVLGPLSVLDAPARALVLNMNQFNGKHGCPSCTMKGETVEGGKGKARIYKGIDFNLRQDEQIRNHGERALVAGIPIFGIKGPTWVSTIPCLDLACSFSPDYMHCVLLGVVRHFLFLWLDTSNHNNTWYIGGKISALDKKLLSIKPLSYIQRLPRSLNKRKLWKASEFRAWLLFYSIPVLNGILIEKYLQHWMLLVHSIFILLKDQVTSQEIDYVEVLLKVFVLDISELYFENVSCTFNSHQLLHLCSFTKNWGPLWISSAFNFETNNGVLLRLIHGSQSVSAQLVNTLRLMNGMWYLSSKYHNNPSQSCMSNTENVLGLEFKGPLPSFLREDCVNIVLTGYIQKGFKIYKRAKKYSEIYTSKIYKRQIKYNNYSVMLNGRLKFGAIQCFLKHEEASSPLFCVIRAYHVDDSKMFCHKLTSTKIEHLVPIKESNMVIVVKFEMIVSKAIVVHDYLSLRPNKVENLL